MTHAEATSKSACAMTPKFRTCLAETWKPNGCPLHMGEGRGCGVCELPKQCLLCPQCAKSVLFSERLVKELDAESSRKTGLEQRLTLALAAQIATSKQLTARESAKRALTAARLRFQQASKRKSIATAASRKLNGELSEKRRRLNESLEKVRDAQGRELSRILAEGQEAISRLHACKEHVVTELRKHVGNLLEVLPISLSRASHESRADRLLPPVNVYVCGFQLPNPAFIGENISMQRTETALGYTVLLAKVMACLLMAPLLSQLKFKGSTSELLEQALSGDRQAVPSSRRLYLAEVQPKPVPSPTISTTTAGPLSILKHHWPWESTYKSTGTAAPSSRENRVKQREELSRAISALSRVVASLRSSGELYVQLHVPPDWPPFAQFAGACMQLAADRHMEGLQSSTQMDLGQVSNEQSSALGWSLRHTLHRGTEEEEIDEWDLVQQPRRLGPVAQRARLDPLRMPPTPSDADELIKHWERAMILDSSRPGSQYARPAHAALGGVIAPLGQGALAAADRLLQGLRWHSS